MSFGAFNPQRRQAMMSDINVTPMVDVMLVLLVIFILAAPLFTHGVQLDLPQTRAGAAPPPRQTVGIAIDAAGRLYWNDAALDAAALDARLAQAAAQSPQPELQLRADKATRYEIVAQVMAAAQARGLTKLGFVTDPQQEHADGQR
jgi:biopolymer transport protein ExbD